MKEYLLTLSPGVGKVTIPPLQTIVTTDVALNKIGEQTACNNISACTPLAHTPNTCDVKTGSVFEFKKEVKD